MATQLGLGAGVPRWRRRVFQKLAPGIIEQNLAAWTQVRLTTATTTLPATLTEATDASATTHLLYTEPVHANGQWILQVDFVPLGDRLLELRGNNNDAILRVNHAALTAVGTAASFVSGGVLAIGAGRYRATMRYTRSASNRITIRANAGTDGAFYQGDGRAALIIHAVGLSAAP